MEKKLKAYNFEVGYSELASIENNTISVLEKRLGIYPVDSNKQKHIVMDCLKNKKSCKSEICHYFINDKCGFKEEKEGKER